MVRVTRLRLHERDSRAARPVRAPRRMRRTLRGEQAARRLRSGRPRARPHRHLTATSGGSVTSRPPTKVPAFRSSPSPHAHPSWRPRRRAAPRRPPPSPPCTPTPQPFWSIGNSSTRVAHVGTRLASEGYRKSRAAGVRDVQISFRGVQNREVLPAASKDGFTAARNEIRTSHPMDGFTPSRDKPSRVRPRAALVRVSDRTDHRTSGV